MPKDLRVLSESKLALWRSAIAIAYADGRLTEKEKTLLRKNIPHSILNDTQKQIIEKDLAEGVKLDEVFSGITDMRDRAHLINFARNLIQVDGKPGISEEAAIECISSNHSDKLNASVQLAVSKLEAESLKTSYKNELRRQNTSDFDGYYYWSLLNLW